MNEDKAAAFGELFKSVVRPFIIIWGFIIYGVCLIKGIAVPDLLGILLSAVILEYFGERAYLRLSNGGKDE